jgi:Trehalase
MYKRALRHPKSLAKEAWTVLIWLRLKARLTTLKNLEIAAAQREKKQVHQAPPQLRVDSPSGTRAHFEPGFAGVYKLLLSNLRLPNGFSAFRYALPSPAFTGIYLWDSAFIAQIWRWWDHETAIEILRAVVAKRDGDRLQHVAKEHAFSPFTQPPLLAWSLVEILKTLPVQESARLAKEFYPILKRYHIWLNKNRQLPNGLFAWASAYESGIDNSPRFSSRDERAVIDTTRLASPDFSAYMVLDCEALAYLARQLTRSDEAAQFESQAQVIKTTMNTYLWHEKDGLYYDRAIDGTWRCSRTIASLLPLWAGVPDTKKAKRLCRHATDSASFGSLIPLPSVALHDPNFEPDMWRGPVWVNTAYAALFGLRRYGFYREAAELAWRLIDGVYQVFDSERQIYEFYHPEVFGVHSLTRKRGNKWKRLTLGSKPQRNFVGWSGLVNTLVIEALFGFGYQDDKRIVQPTFPGAAIGSTFRLSLPAENLIITLHVESRQRVTGAITAKGSSHHFRATFAEIINLDTLID